MRLKTFCVLLVGLNACGSMPIESNIPYSSANRYAIEMENDCNLTTSSIGINGCAFKKSELAGNIRFASLWSGDLTLNSYYCDNISVAANAVQDNIFKIAKMYTTTTNNSCVFNITRSIREGKFISDQVMLGKFVIKIIPDNEYWDALTFSVDNKKNFYKGVGWLQKETLKPDPPITLYPKSKSGNLTVSCNNSIVKQFEYSTTPIKLALNSEINCDYEIQAAAYDLPITEIATYIHSVYKPTTDITPPVMTVTKKKITATFTDKDSLGKMPLVYGVQIDNVKCIKTNVCSITNTNKDTYVVKGLTPNLSFARWTYNKKLNTFTEE